MKKLLGKGKAQVTIFLIIGIILLFSSAILFYIQGKVATTGDFAPVLESVPLQIRPVQIYVDNCVQQVTKEAIKQIGLHGGYINISDRELSMETFRMDLTPTESDALTLFGKGTEIPYWFYLSSDNKCIDACEFSSKRPFLRKNQGQKSIEVQINKYVERELPNCINDFTLLKAQGFGIEKTGKIVSDFRVAFDDVGIIVTYPLKITTDGKEAEINSFYSKFDVPLSRLYDLAEEITKAQQEFQFMDVHVLNLITQYSYPTSKDRIPPMATVDFGGDYNMWTRTQTQERLENYVLPQAMSMLQVAGTGNMYHRNILKPDATPNHVLTGLTDLMDLYINTTEDYGAFDSTFVYMDSWPIYLYMDSEILKPMSMATEYIPGLNMRNYYFHYDVSYPVMVMLEDKSAFNGEGYKFIFAMEGNIRRNRVMNSSYQNFNVGSKFFRSNLCDEKHRTSGIVNISVINLYTKEPIVGARIESLYGDNMCHQGETEEKNGVGYLETKFVAGLGRLQVYKEGYAQYTGKFMISDEQTDSYVIEMVPEKDLEVIVKPKLLNFMMGTGGSYGLIKTDDGQLSINHQVFLEFTRINDDEYKGYSSTLIYEPSKSLKTKMKIIPGKYEVEGYLMDKKGITLERQIIREEIPFGDDVEQVLNSTTINPWPEGGLVLNDGYYVEIPIDAITGNKTMKFKVLRFPLPMKQVRYEEDVSSLDQLSEHEKYSKLYYEELQPEFY